MAYLETVASSALDFENFFSAKLTSSLTAADTDIPMDDVPSISEGVLVVDWDVAASREVIFFNSKTASKVVCPSAANGRGFDGSTATTHASGANVIMAPVADYFRYIKYIATTSTAAWKPLGYTPDTIVDNGNRQYTMVFNSVDLTSFISNGMRLRGDPATTKPTQCADLEASSSQYFNDTSPAGMTFTDDFCAGGWIKPESYTAGVIISRRSAASGWGLRFLSDGTITLIGYNASTANTSQVTGYPSVSLNRWTHVAAQLDMSAFTATTTTSYVMIDGINVPAAVARAGTNPTALVQAGDLNVGAIESLVHFDGKLAQVFVTSAKVTQDNMRLIKNQGITSADCATYNIVSAYTLSGASGLTDINTTNANNLTAQGGALTTNADSPFGLDDNGTPGNYEWGIVTSKSFATNTTITVQAPEGSTWPTLPTSAMITSMDYSTEKVPYGFPIDESRWVVESINKNDLRNLTAATSTWYSGVSNGQLAMTVPVGAWYLGFEGSAYDGNAGVSTTVNVQSSLSTSNNSESDTSFTTDSIMAGASASSLVISVPVYMYKHKKLSAATTYYLISRSTATSTSVGFRGDRSETVIKARPAFL